jgi:hypothetical protein
MYRIIFASTILLFIVTTSYANPVCNVGREKARADLLKELTEIFAPNYSAIDSLLKSNMEDFDAICKLPDSQTSNEVLQFLKDIFYPFFSNIIDQYAEQMKSYQALHNQETAVRAPWDQLRDPAVCDLSHFIVGARYSNVSTKRDIERKCGRPDHTSGPKYSTDSKGNRKLIENERWYYEFEKERFIFVFNNQGLLIEKKSPRRR